MKKIMIAVVMLAMSMPVMADTEGGLFGALIGGVLGNQVGKGNGKKLATVVGVIAGAGIGSNVQDRMNEDKNEDADYVCVNCGSQETQTAQSRSRYRSAGEEAAAYRGASDRRAMEQKYLEQRAYCNENPHGCQSGRYRSHNYAGSYYSRNLGR